MKKNGLELGIVGLGKIGGNLASQALEKDMHVVGLTKGETPEELLNEGLIKAESAKGFLDHFHDGLPVRRIDNFHRLYRVLYVQILSC